VPVALPPRLWLNLNHNEPLPSRPSPFAAFGEAGRKPSLSFTWTVFIEFPSKNALFSPKFGFVSRLHSYIH